MWDYFKDEYLPNPDAPWGRFALRTIAQDSLVDGATNVRVVIADNGADVELTGSGNGPIAAFCDALASHGVDVRVLDYNEHAMSSGGDAAAASYLECAVGGRVLWGVGIDPSIVTSSLKAVVSAVNRAERDAAS
jgi:2-isopropylmalate synthase